MKIASFAGCVLSLRLPFHLLMWCGNVVLTQQRRAESDCRLTRQCDAEIDVQMQRTM